MSIMNNPDDDGAIIITTNDLDVVTNGRGDDAPGGADAGTDTAARRLEMATLPLPPPPTRRRSLRQTVEPDRFVARPSLQGLTNEDGDAMFLARGVLVGGMATGGNHFPEGADADEGNDEPKHPFRVKHEDHTKNERAVELEADKPIHRTSFSLSMEGSNCDDLVLLDRKRPQDPQVDVPASENTMPTESYVNHHGTEFIGNQETHSAQDSNVSPALEKSDALSESIQSEQNSNNLTNDENLRDDNVEFKLSTPVIDHTSKQSVNHSFDVDTQFRYPTRKRSTKSRNDECDSGEDEGNDGGDDDARSAMAATEGDITSTTDYEGKLDFKISPFPPSHRMCKAVSCTKYAQGGKGLCCYHYTRYLVCTGKCASWTCDNCGGKNKATCRRCHKCQVKFGNSVKLKGKKKTYSSSLGGIVNEEKEVELIRATSVVAFEGSNPRSDRPDPSHGGELDSRNPKRTARNSAEEVLTSGVKIDVSSTPSHRGKKTVPNSTSSSMSCSNKINTLYDHLLDFSVSSPSSPTKMKGYYCRATSCNKRTQSLSNGFCRRHRNRYLICTGQCDFWTCDCGNKNIHYAKQCAICHTPSSEASPMSSKSMISPVAALATSSALVSFANVPELTLLERTRSELLNGRDCWICIDCAVEVPSITYPCWKCNKMISFVPLEVEEFEEFVQKQREMNMKRRQEEEKRHIRS